MTLIYFILVLGITVLIHEMGHFIFAKRAGIYVYEFSIGMGPRLFKFKRKNDETEYSIRLFPIGGFVQMAGEEVDDDKNIPDDKKMQTKTWLQRFLTIVAGVMFNFILAIVLLFVVGLVNGSNLGSTRVSKLDKTLPAYKSGLRENDVIKKINNVKTSNSDKLLLELQVNMGKEITLSVSRDGSLTDVKIKPKKIKVDGESSYQYGFALDTNRETGFLAAVKYAFIKFKNLITQMFYIIVYLFVGKLKLSSLSGPIGIFNLVGETAKAGFINMVYLVAYLSINVGFINLLPVPAFDGGRILFLIIEKFKGSPVNPKIENIIHSIGFVLLMLLMIVITCNDITRLFH